MNIFFQLIYSKKAYGESKNFVDDHRFWILKGIADILVSRGHVVYILKMNYPPVKNLGMDKFILSKTKKPNIKFDLAVVHSDMKYAKHYLKEEFKSKPKACFDYSFLPESLIIDTGGLFNNSKNYMKMQNILDKIIITDSLRQKCVSMIKENKSKRPQKRIDKIPSSKYIFIPGQVLNDKSIMKHSKWNQLTFIEKVINFGIEKGLDIVFKPHPGMRYDVAKHGRQIIEDRCKEWKKLYKNFYVVNTSIYDLIQQAQFTACINSGSVIDNFICQSPVYCAGNMYWTNTKAVVHNENVDEGLLTMFNKEYNLVTMKETQLRAVQWCLNNLLFKNNSPIENYKRFLRLTGFKL